MSGTTPPPPDDAWLDALLQPSTVDDAGFVNDVADALPAVRDVRARGDRNAIVVAGYLSAVVAAVIAVVARFGADVDVVASAWAAHTLSVRLTPADLVPLAWTAATLVALPIALLAAAMMSGERLRLRRPLFDTAPSAPTLTLPELLSSTASVPALSRRLDGALAPSSITSVDDLDADALERLGTLSGGANPVVMRRLFFIMLAIGMASGVVVGVSEEARVSGLAVGLAVVFVAVLLGGTRRLIVRDAEAALVDYGFAPALARALAEADVRVPFKSLRDLWDASVRFRDVDYLRERGRRVVDVYRERAARIDVANDDDGAKPR